MSIKKYGYKLLRISESNADTCDESPTKREVFLNQLLDAFVIGGIAGFSAFTAAGDSAGIKVFGLAFLITFLIKLKEYRKIE